MENSDVKQENYQRFVWVIASVIISTVVGASATGVINMFDRLYEMKSNIQLMETHIEQISHLLTKIADKSCP